jgi:DNA polymerase-3 subunit gamma/tau
MAYQALYRKYRPNSFDDFIDQDNIKKILANSIKNNKISHAYLFSGPRGIGKTSMAKIFAKAINCENFAKNGDVCNKCEHCQEADNGSVDIIEIDAASNNGVDQIRDLRNKISIVPSSLNYKVYIIDEVHMLTNSAFNALLKTLEEPPSYVVFILATTEFYEVPETIVSRCQCYSFGRITLKSLEERLNYIAKNEKIDITPEAITEIAQYANGGLRDAISMLDKIRSFTDEKITVDVFKEINGMVSQQEINLFYESIFNKNIPQILDIINKIDETGYDFKNFVERVMLLARDNIVEYYTNKKEIIGNINDNVKLVTILNDILNRLKEAINPMVIVQVFILKFIEENNVEALPKEEKNIAREIILPEKEEKTTPLNEESVVEEQKKEVKEIKKTKSSKKSEIVVNEETKKIRINNTLATAEKKYKTELQKIWKDLDKYFMDEKYSKVAQLLSDTIPDVVGTDYMILSVPTEGIINNIYANLVQVENFIKEIYHLMKIVVVTTTEADSIKQKYVDDKANKIKYEMLEENDKLVSENSDLINQALDLFGSDLVDIE